MKYMTKYFRPLRGSDLKVNTEYKYPVTKVRHEILEKCATLIPLISDVKTSAQNRIHNDEYLL